MEWKDRDEGGESWPMALKKKGEAKSGVKFGWRAHRKHCGTWAWRPGPAVGAGRNADDLTQERREG